MIIISRSIKRPLDEDNQDTMKAYKVLKVIITMNMLASMIGVLMAMLLVCGLLYDKPCLVFANIVFIALMIPICFVNVFQTYAMCFAIIQLYFIFVIFNYYLVTQGIK